MNDQGRRLYYFGGAADFWPLFLGSAAWIVQKMPSGEIVFIGLDREEAPPPHRTKEPTR